MIEIFKSNSYGSKLVNGYQKKIIIYSNTSIF